MLSESINNHNMPELFELLQIHTMELLHLLNDSNPDEMIVYRKKADVQLIQSVILKRKAELSILHASLA